MPLPTCVSLPRLRAAALCAALALIASTAFATPDSAEPLGLQSSAGLAGVAALSSEAREQPDGAVGLLADASPGTGSRASELVMLALNYVGVQYQRGGNSEEVGFDCSGFTRHVFTRTLGRLLPRRAEGQARDPALTPVGRDNLQPGDLVFFNTLKQTFSHVGIYIGAHRFVHAPRPGSQVRTDDMRLAYWSERYTGARRAGDVPAIGPGGVSPRPAPLPDDPPVR